jgi:PAS domain S-box-containing protein
VHLTDTTDMHTLRADVAASEAQAHEHLRKLKVLYDTAPVGLCELDLELRYVRINEALARMNGHPAAEHIGRTVMEMLPEYGARYEEEFRRVLATGIPVFEKEIEGYTDSDPGVRHWWLESWYPIFDNQGAVEGLSVVAQDVSALKRAEASLRQRETQLRVAVEAANLSAYEWDIPSGIVTRLGEVPEDAPLGARYTFDDLVSMVHPDDQASMLGRIEGTLRGETDVYISEHRSNENPKREWCWARVRGRVIRSAEGTPLVMIGVSMDITEHKRLEEALHDADRRKDDFLATLAHELRNPLAPIRNALHLLKTHTPVPKEMSHGRDVIDRQVSQMARLLDDLLDVSRISRGTMELRLDVVGIREVIDRALETSHPLIAERGHRVRLVFEGDENPPVDADVMRLAQVFANLLNNAAKYMDNDGHITVSTRRQGSDVLVSVRDTGIGIDDDNLTKSSRCSPGGRRRRTGRATGWASACRWRAAS